MDKKKTVKVKNNQLNDYKVEKGFNIKRHKPHSSISDLKSILKQPGTPQQSQTSQLRIQKMTQMSQDQHTESPLAFKRMESSIMQGSSIDRRQAKSPKKVPQSAFLKKGSVPVIVTDSTTINKYSLHLAAQTKNSIHDLKLESTDYQLDDFSENDIFDTNRQQDFQKPHSRIIKTRVPNKIINKIAYITQKMTPCYQDNLMILESVENKVLDQIRVDSDPNQLKFKSIQPFNPLEGYNEVQIYYDQSKHPIEILPDVWNVQEVRQMEFYYFKTPFHFMMKQSNLQSSFKIFVSQYNAFPTKFSCDHIFTVKGWKIKNDGANGIKSFTTDYIYISFVSEHDMFIKMKFSFGDVIPKSEIKPQLKQQSNMYHSMTTDMLFSEIADIKKRRRQKLLMMHDGGIKDIVKENTQMMQYSTQSQESFRQCRKQVYEEKFQIVIDKKKKMDIQEKDIKSLKYKSREAAKIINIQLRKILNAKENKRFLCSSWLLYIQFALSANKLSTTFQHKIETIKQSRLMAFQVKRIMRRITKNLTLQKGYSIFDRMKHDARTCLEIFCKQIYKKHQRIAIKELVPILTTRAVVFNMKTRMLLTYQKITKVRQKFQEFLVKKRNFKLLLASLWEKYKAKAHTYALRNVEEEKVFLDWYAYVQNDVKVQRQLGDLFTKMYFANRVQTFHHEWKDYFRKTRHSRKKTSMVNPFLIQTESILLSDNFQANDDLELEKLIHMQQQTSQKSITVVEKPRLFVVPMLEEIQHLYIQMFRQTNAKWLKPMLNSQSSMRNLSHSPSLKRQPTMMKSSMKKR